MQEKKSPVTLERKLAWVARKLEAHFGCPEQPKRSRNPLNELVRTILSQNTTDVNSGRAYRSLRREFPSWEDVLQAPIRSIAASIRCGGLANQKSRRLRIILQWVRSRFGQLSLNSLHKKTDNEIYNLLTPLPGIGPKTVSVLLAFALDRDVFPIDTHVHRVIRRLGLIPHRMSAEKADKEMAPVLPKGKGYSLHVNIVRLGKMICRPRNPKCSECPLNTRCIEYQEMK